MSDLTAENEGNHASKLLRIWVAVIKSGDPKQVTDLYHENAILLEHFPIRKGLDIH